MDPTTKEVVMSFLTDLADTSFCNVLLRTALAFDNLISPDALIMEVGTGESLYTSSCLTSTSRELV